MAATPVSTARSETRVEFDSVDEMELAEHPTIKGLPRKHQNMGETLLGGEKGLPWLRIPDHVARLGRVLSLQFGLVRVLAGWVPNCPSYALKTELPRLMYEDMRHLVRLHERFNQLPGSGSGIEPSAELKAFLNALGQADDHHWFPVMAQQTGDTRPLRELVKSLRQKSILARQFKAVELTEDEKLEIAQSATAFCNAIEFDLDFTIY